MAAVVAQNGALQGAAQALLTGKIQESLVASADYSGYALAANSFALQVSSSVGVITTRDHQVLVAMISAGALMGRPITEVNNTPGASNPYYPVSQAIAEAYTVAVAKLGVSRAHDGSFQGAMFAALAGRDIEGLVASGDYTALVNAADAFATEVATVVTAPTTDDTQAVLAQICAGVLQGRYLTSLTGTDYLALANGIAEAYTVAVAKITGGSLSHYGAFQGTMAAVLGGPADIQNLTASADYTALVNAADSFALQVSATVGVTATTDLQGLVQGISAGAMFGRFLTIVNATPGVSNPYYNTSLSVGEAYTVYSAYITA
jgi:hypothetical protein